MPGIVILREVTSMRNEPRHYVIKFVIETKTIDIASVRQYHWAEKLATMVAKEHGATLDNRLIKEK